MTEAEWLAAPGAWQLFEHLEPIGDARKLRLFGCACCHRVWHLFNDSSRDIAAVGERYADGKASELELRDTFLFAEDMTRQEWGNDSISFHTLRAAMWLSSREVGEAAWNCSTEVTKAVRAVARYAGQLEGAVGPERELQTRLLREIFGNPFRPVAFSPDWRTDTAVTLARQMYDAREFSAAPILADALQDAGCDSEELLNHLRDTSATHVRGCWALDLVLGKE